MQNAVLNMNFTALPMVRILDGNSEIEAITIIWSVKGIWLVQKCSRIDFFSSPKKTYYYVHATSSELPNNISTMTLPDTCCSRYRETSAVNPRYAVHHAVNWRGTTMCSAKDKDNSFAKEYSDYSSTTNVRRRTLCYAGVNKSEFTDK